MAWNVNIMPLRTLDRLGSGSVADTINGMNWAIKHNADVINLSLGGTGYVQAMQDAVNSAHAQGILIVAAMGNCRTEGPDCPEANPTLYPAAYNNVMAVAATNYYDTWSAFSQYGSHCDIAAPGGEMTYYHDPDGIYSTMPTYDVYLTTGSSYSKNYDYLQGTSQATPYVAGLAALILSADPTLSPTEVQSLIENTAEDIGNDGWDPNYGHGRIEAAAALQALLPATPTLNPISNGTNAADYLVDWGGIANADQYVLEEDDNSSFSSPDTRYVGPDSAYNVTGQPGGDWYYRVRAINSVGASVWSASVSTTVDPLALPDPTLSPINNPDKSQDYTVGWRDTGADYYTLEESHTPYFEAPTQVYSDTGTAYTATDQPLGTWYYRVRAFDVNGDSSTWSNIESTRVAPYEVFLPLVLRNAP
jgi:hypothetical protein